MEAGRMRGRKEKLAEGGEGTSGARYYVGGAVFSSATADEKATAKWRLRDADYDIDIRFAASNDTYVPIDSSADTSKITLYLEKTNEAGEPEADANGKTTYEQGADNAAARFQAAARAYPAGDRLSGGSPAG